MNHVHLSFKKRFRAHGQKQRVAQEGEVKGLAVEEYDPLGLFVSHTDVLVFAETSETRVRAGDDLDILPACDH
ncbi:hypothetical protein [Candidatus Pantoea multigeneris]|uniref:Uncharacterized protein n=1 Tax=Candidatus Pantoea multigeneris TaxID=2608357 RepID=A0ABX0RC55_9GAMM|nr:hypothetical protein [Pantoea multigeneris]NIF22138.1 hypothetical protein [Pantoea multigeneris]